MALMSMAMAITSIMLSIEASGVMRADEAARSEH
jgi:hypothetical protein